MYIFTCIRHEWHLYR